MLLGRLPLKLVFAVGSVGSKTVSRIHRKNLEQMQAELTNDCLVAQRAVHLPD